MTMSRGGCPRNVAQGEVSRNAACSRVGRSVCSEADLEAAARSAEAKRTATVRRQTSSADGDDDDDGGGGWSPVTVRRANRRCRGEDGNGFGGRRRRENGLLKPFRN
ncbi:hypothetical protein Syun_002151 [Stephania yunnanensis]|uniref:Uncharacterized protein n=1 Tax=Stephania yunnanensis TaxID=152371 RepID=A0AAP0LFC4_9MAGN